MSIYSKTSFGAIVLILLMGLAAKAAPFRQVARGHGLVMELSGFEIGDPVGGYYPIRVKLSNTGPARRLRVVSETWGYARKSEVSRTVEIEKLGKAEFVLSVPITEPHHYGNICVYEGRTQLDKLTRGGFGTNWFGNQSPYHCLLVANRPPDTRPFCTGLNNNFASQSELAAVVPAVDLPGKWIDYTSRDLVVISIDDLEQLDPGKLRALTAWALQGGSLIVHGLNESPENDPRMLAILEPDSHPPASEQWKQPMVGNRRSGAQTTGRASPDQFEFKVRSYGFGRLAVLRGDPFPGTGDDWSWVINELGRTAISWEARHGITPRSGNDSFWEFLIPGIGKAPVTTFQILISLFVIVIGPVNYFMLRQRNRLHLLIITVPVIALSTSAFVLGWGIAADGFGTHIRVRSLTMLNQRKSESTSWARLSYYAGLAPFDGLYFSEDTAVYPIESDNATARPRLVQWGDEQHLAMGWLPSRTPTQFLTVDHRHSTEHLRITKLNDGGLLVTNNLDTYLRNAFIAADDGTIHQVSGLRKGERKSASLVEAEKAVAMISELLGEQSLDVPLDFSQNNVMDFMGRGNYRNWTSEWATSLQERFFRNLASSVPSLRNTLSPGNYVAFTERPPQIEFGTSDVKLSESNLFVIWGIY